MTLVPPPSECSRPDAADMAQMLLMSKQDYARWHSYELHISTAVSPGVRPASSQLAHACPVQQWTAWHAYMSVSMNFCGVNSGSAELCSPAVLHEPRLPQKCLDWQSPMRYEIFLWLAWSWQPLKVEL